MSNWYFKLAILAGGIAAFTACVDGGDGSSDKDGTTDDGTDDGTDGDTDEDTALDTADTDDTGDAFFDGPPEFQDGTWDATCGGTSVLTVSAATDGWVYGPGGAGTEAILNIFETRFTVDWDEEHPLHEDAHAADGTWTDLIDDLDEGETTSGWVPGESTHFTCVAADTDKNLTYAARVYDIDGNISDCVAWGHDPVGVISDTVSGSTGQNSVYAIPAEITANCWDGN